MVYAGVEDVLGTQGALAHRALVIVENGKLFAPRESAQAVEEHRGGTWCGDWGSCSRKLTKEEV